MSWMKCKKKKITPSHQAIFNTQNFNSNISQSGSSTVHYILDSNECWCPDAQSWDAYFSLAIINNDCYLHMFIDITQKG